MPEAIQIPGTNWFIKLSIAHNVSKDLVINFLRSNHKIHEFVLERDGNLKEIIEKFMMHEAIDIPELRIENIINQLENQLYNLQRQKSKSTERMNIKNILKLPMMTDKKIIMMGLTGAGKRSIYEVVFSGKNWWEIEKMPSTRGLHKYQQIIKPNEGYDLFIWDLGGLEEHIENYSINEPVVYNKSTAGIFVVDASDPPTFEKAREDFQSMIKNLARYSPDSLIYCFINKIDMFPNRVEVFKRVKRFFDFKTFTKEEFSELRQPIIYLSTSVKDNSIFEAFENIFKLIVPKSKRLNFLADNLKKEAGFYNVLVLEKRTGLPICSSSFIFDDIVLVGTIDKLWEYTKKLTLDLELTIMEKIMVRCNNGYISLEEFEENLLLLLISPDMETLEKPANKKLLKNFKLDMRNTI